MIRFNIVLIIIILIQLNAISQENKYSQKQLQEDIKYLHLELEKRHPNLYLHSSKIKIDSFFKSLNESLPSSMTELAFYSYITPINSIIKDGHTLFFPSIDYVEYHNSSSKYFPFKVSWDGKKLYVELNYFKEDEIENGAEIISINNKSCIEIMDYMLVRMMRDGENKTYPIWVLNNWFNEYYSYFFGHFDSYLIEYKLDGQKSVRKELNALTKSEINQNRRQRYPNKTFSRVKDQKEGRGIKLEMRRDLDIAILRIKEFDDRILKSVYNQSFEDTIDKIFENIAESEFNNLILDLRDNQGGSIKNGKILLSYILEKPFEIVSGYKRVNQGKYRDSINRIESCKGPQLGFHKSKKNAFKGKVYVLINGGSFSNTGIVCSILNQKGRAIFIGEETGGSEYILGGSIKKVELPNTRIRVEIPKLQFVIKENKGDKWQGVVPNIEIRPTINEIIKNRDVIKEYALNMVGE